MEWETGEVHRLRGHFARPPGNRGRGGHRIRDLAEYVTEVGTSVMRLPRFRIRTLMITVALAGLLLTLFEGTWQTVVFGVIGPAIMTYSHIAQHAPPTDRARRVQAWLRAFIIGGVVSCVAAFVYRSVREYGPQGLVHAAVFLLAVLVLGAVPALLLWAVLAKSRIQDCRKTSEPPECPHSPER